MTDKELFQQAKDALLELWSGCPKDQEIIEALNERLAQPEPEPEPVAIVIGTSNREGMIRWCQPKRIELDTPLYTAQTKKEWVSLTDEEILEEYRRWYGDDGNLTDVYFVRVIESKLKEKNA